GYPDGAGGSVRQPPLRPHRLPEAQQCAHPAGNGLSDPGGRVGNLVWNRPDHPDRALQGVPRMGGSADRLGTRRCKLISLSVVIRENYSLPLMGFGCPFIARKRLFWDILPVNLLRSSPMRRMSTRSLLAASALSVFALTVAVPAISAGGQNSMFSIAAVAQEAGFPIIVNADQFAELAEKGAKIVDVRPQAAFEQGHIPGAVNLPWAKLNVSERDGIRNEFQPDDVIEQIISEAGLENGDTLLIYDNNSLPGRAFIALEYAGFKNIHVLDGGVAAFNGELETGPVQIAASEFKLTDKFDMRVDKAYVESRMNAPDAVVIDGRGSDAFVDGHIPGAKSLVASHLLTEERKVQPEDVINNLLAARGIDKEKEILSYCGS